MVAFDWLVWLLVLYSDLLSRWNCCQVVRCYQCYYYNYYNHWTVSETTRVSRYQEGKTNLDLLNQEIVSGSGISWAICKSTPRPRQNNHASIQPLRFLQAGCPSCRPTNSVKALKANSVVQMRDGQTKKQTRKLNVFGRPGGSWSPSPTKLGVVIEDLEHEGVRRSFPARGVLKIWGNHPLSSNNPPITA